MKVYLAGPILMCSDDEAHEWREKAKARLGEDNCLDPMRRDYRGREGAFYTSIVEKDKRDILGAGFVLANCWQPSVGTSMEILYNWEQGGYTVAVVQPWAKVSPWLKYHCEEIFEDLDEAISAVQNRNRAFEFAAQLRS